MPTNTNVYKPVRVNFKNAETKVSYTAYNLHKMQKQKCHTPLIIYTDFQKIMSGKSH